MEWFTSDTHFGAQRTLELSRRPFDSVACMDWTIVRNWNSIVGRSDTVYHLGDFGNWSMLGYLNGNIILLPGNYDEPIDVYRSGVRTIKSGHVQWFNDVRLKMVHDPLSAKKSLPEQSTMDEDPFYLFGHIHKLQMVKENGLNVGVDCHNFCPIDLDTVLFYRNAIINHYDENVFCP